jgi:hypothetical protein
MRRTQSWYNPSEIKGTHSFVVMKAFGRLEKSGLMIPDELRTAKARISLECALILPIIEQDTLVHIKI